MQMWRSIKGPIHQIKPMHIRHPGNIAERKRVTTQKFATIRQHFIEMDKSFVGGINRRFNSRRLKAIGKI